MEPKVIQSISQEVYRRFPMLAGRRPRVQTYKTSSGRFGRALSPGQPAYLLIYQGQGQTVTNRKIPVIVRVVVDGNGKVLKMSSSR